MPTTTPETTADALARFEAFVLSQQPASKPWQPVTDYSFEARKAIEGIHPQLIRDVFQPRRVTDVGCGFPPILLDLLRELHVDGIGLDTRAPTGLVHARVSWFNLGSSYVGIDFWELGSWESDLVICREVLEHLTVLQIRQAVTNLCKLSTQFIYVTTRFAKAPQSLLDVDTSDDLDPTHMTMLHQDFLRVLFVLEGFKRRADLEERLDWQHKGRVLVYERVV